jgi:hypothetical protein
MDPPLAPRPEGRGRKRQRDMTTPLGPGITSQSQNKQNSMIQTPGGLSASEGVPDPSHLPSTANVSPESIDTSSMAPGSAMLNQGAPLIQPPTAPRKNTLSEGAPNTHTAAPDGISSSEGATDIGNAAPGRILSPEGAPNGHSPVNTITQSQFDIAPTARPHYSIYHGNHNFISSKKSLGIDGNIFVLHTNVINQQTYRYEPLPPDMLHFSPHVFQSFVDLPYTPTDATLSAYLIADSKEDTLTQSQMFRAHDMSDFIKAQIPEIRGLERMDIFAYKPIHELPPKARLLSSIWSYRRKRRPNGVLLKHKSRLCVDGSQQLFGRDYWETYAPVVSWSTIRLVLLLSTILNLKSRQVDYTQAFPQAGLSDPVFM